MTGFMWWHADMWSVISILFYLQSHSLQLSVSSFLSKHICKWVLNIRLKIPEVVPGSSEHWYESIMLSVIEVMNASIKQSNIVKQNDFRKCVVVRRSIDVQVREKIFSLSRLCRKVVLRLVYCLHSPKVGGSSSWYLEERSWVENRCGYSLGSTAFYFHMTFASAGIGMNRHKTVIACIFTCLFFMGLF